MTGDDLRSKLYPTLVVEEADYVEVEHSPRLQGDGGSPL